MAENSKIQWTAVTDVNQQGRLVPGYPCYCVTHDGRVWTRFKRVGKRPRVIGAEWVEKTGCPSNKGHLRVELHSLATGVKPRKFMVHVLVLELFVGPRPDGMEACHEDGDPNNNHVSNLRWDTPEGNWADRKRHGRGGEGVKSPQAKLTDDAVRDIRESRKCGVKLKVLAAKYGVSIAKISQVAKGKNWSHVDG